MVAAVLAPHQHSPSPSHQQELLFKKLFGNEETDLIDESEAEGAAGGEASGEAGDGAKPPAVAMALEIKEGETAAAFARRVFRAVFDKATPDVGKKLTHFLATGNLVSESGLDLQQTAGFVITGERLNFWRYAACRP